MGFCLFSNAAIAYYALEQPESIVAILTGMCITAMAQAIVENHPQIAYCSLHQFLAILGSAEQGGYQNVESAPAFGQHGGSTSRCLKKSDAVFI